MRFPRVSIIILNWNGWEDTIECLESLYRITYPNYDVIVVDNGSKDDSIQKIKEYAKGKIRVDSKFFEYSPANKPIKVFEVSEDEAKQGKFDKAVYEKYDVDRRMILIKNKDNYGFAGGNNVGIKFALSVLDPDYVLLLNNDTVVDLNFLFELVKVAEGDRRIGMIGPKVLYYDQPNIITYVGGIINSKNGKNYHPFLDTLDTNITEKNIELDYIAGCSLLVRSKLMFSIGLLDQNYFLYYEDAKWGFQAKKYGYNVVYAPKAKIWHKLSRSSNKLSAHSTYYAIRNRLLLIREICPVSSFIHILIRYIISNEILVVKLILKREFNVTKAVIKAVIDGIMNKNHKYGGN